MFVTPYDLVQRHKRKAKITLAKISPECILFLVKEAWRLAFPARMKLAVGLLPSRNSSIPPCVASALPSTADAGTPAFTSGHALASRRFPEALKHHSCLHTIIPNLVAHLH